MKYEIGYTFMTKQNGMAVIKEHIDRCNKVIMLEHTKRCLRRI